MEAMQDSPLNWDYASGNPVPRGRSILPAGRRAAVQESTVDMESTGRCVGKHEESGLVPDGLVRRRRPRDTDDLRGTPRRSETPLPRIRL